jgi:hypothetical protein
MPQNDYTPKEALDLLIQKIEPVSPDLAKRIQLAIDSGKDVQAEEANLPGAGRRGSRRRFYRKHVAYSDEEALNVALGVLESHLVESRMLVRAAHTEFRHVGLAPPKPLKPTPAPANAEQAALPLEMDSPGEDAEVHAVEAPKAITIEAEPEATQEKRNPPDLRLETINDEQLNSLRDIFKTLKALTKFEDESDGHTA